MDAAARLRPFLLDDGLAPSTLGVDLLTTGPCYIHAARGWITALPPCSTAAYGAALPRAAENATMQGFPRRAPTLTATGESVGPGPARDTVARGPALAPAFP